MDNPRASKVAVVAEVTQKFEQADSVVLTEYRGLNVPAMAALRRAIVDVGGEYRIYKNTLVRRAVDELGIEIDELLVGPTAIAFVGRGDDGSRGDAVGVAKALVEFTRDHPALVIKGGLLDDQLLSVDQVTELSKIAPREELLSRLAGGLAAPMQRFAGLLSALPRDFAYALRALIDEGGEAGAGSEVAEDEGGSAEGGEAGAGSEVAEDEQGSAEGGEDIASAEDGEAGAGSEVAEDEGGSAEGGEAGAGSEVAEDEGGSAEGGEDIESAAGGTVDDEGSAEGGEDIESAAGGTVDEQGSAEGGEGIEQGSAAGGEDKED